MNSGNYRLKSVEATQNDQKYVAEFDNNYKNLPEQGLIIMKIKVKNELVEAVQTEKKQNKTDQQNNIQNPEKSDSGIKNTEVVTTVEKNRTENRNHYWRFEFSGCGNVVIISEISL